MVAIETVETTATRNPPTIAGTASGSRIRQRICRPVRPIPFAASTTSSGVPCRPTMMFGSKITSV